MAVNRKPLSARINLTNSAKESVQTLGKLRSDLQSTQINGIFQAVNAIRRNETGYPVTGGLYTVTDELTV